MAWERNCQIVPSIQPSHDVSAWFDWYRLALATVPALLLLPVAVAEPVGRTGWDNRSSPGFVRTLAYLEEWCVVRTGQELALDRGEGRR
ncbi:hypothetical protein [Haloarcula brevis]|uniref:hypothetical protein n=1 Tax=Haloarcula brevis TaxID=3111453 RepID=UPI00300EA1EA